MMLCIGTIMQAIYKLCLLLFGILLSISGPVYFLMVWCNPDPIRDVAYGYHPTVTSVNRTLLSTIMSNECTWVPEQPEPLIEAWNKRS